MSALVLLVHYCVLSVDGEDDVTCEFLHCNQTVTMFVIKFAIVPLIQCARA